MATITRSEWLKALGEADQPQLSEGQTIKEIALTLEMGESSAKRRIAKLKDEGKVVCGLRGRLKVYQLKGGKKG